MDKSLVKKLFTSFESIRDEKEGIDFRYARDMQKLLGYKDWRNFLRVIAKAKESCKMSGNQVMNHFVDVTKKVVVGSSAEREIEDVALSRYACYLIAQNGDPRKEEIAFAQTYFAQQTRKQEVIEQKMLEYERLYARMKQKKTEKEFHSLAFRRGADSRGIASIISHGDAVLFGGYSTAEMKEKLKVPKGKPLADFLPMVTIKAKDLAAEVTNYKLRQDKGIRGTDKIRQEFEQNSKGVRDYLVKSGIIPERLPPAPDISKIERQKIKEDKVGLKQVEGLPPLYDGEATYSFALPDDARVLEQVVQAIKSFPGEVDILLGEHSVGLSQEGVSALLKVLDQE